MNVGIGTEAKGSFISGDIRIFGILSVQRRGPAESMTPGITDSPIVPIAEKISIPIVVVRQYDNLCFFNTTARTGRISSNKT
jgi:hypothetical protein